MPLAFFYAMFAAGCLLRKPVGWTIIGATPMIFLVLMRGNVGTDTPYYISAIDQIRSSGSNSTEIFEPLFQWILATLGLLPLPSWMILAFVSLSTTLLFFKGWVRIEPSLIVFAGVYSQFFVDMTMNGIRYGLAFSLIVFGSRFLLARKLYIFWAFVLVATFIQISSALLAVLLYFLHLQRWRTVLYGVTLGCLVGLNFSDRLLLKLVAYELESIPGAFSGFMPLASIWLILAIWSLDSHARKKAATKIIGLAIISVAFYGVAQITYAGLRFLQLTLFLSALTLVCHLNVNRMKLHYRSVVFLIVVGMFFGFMKLRHYNVTIDTAPAQYIPYKFYWEDY